MTLHARLPLHLRLDVWPFAIVYAGLVAVGRGVGADGFETGLLVAVGVVAHSLAHLSTHWSVRPMRREGTAREPRRQCGVTRG